MKRTLTVGGESVSQVDQEGLQLRKNGASSWTIQTLLIDGARAWNVSQKTMILFWALPFLVAASGVVAAILGKPAYKWLTQEDGFAENMQVLFWALSFVLSLIVTYRQWRRGNKTIAFLYSFLCFGLFFLIGEEVSWGQRIFGWATPKELQAINKQEETNIHNIYGVGATFKWVHVVIGAYGTFMPILLLRAKALARYRDKLSALVPHISFLPYFLLPLAWRLYVNLFKPPRRFTFVVDEYSEVIELILAIGFFFFMIFQLKQLKHEKA
jgi:hypothetical protein